MDHATIVGGGQAARDLRAERAHRAGRGRHQQRLAGLDRAVVVAAAEDELVQRQAPDRLDARVVAEHAHVVAAEFKGKSRVQQHQIVYKALQGRMGGQLHALALQTAPLD